MLEVRRPGPTFRAWDNVRFPARSIDIDATLDVLNLDATDPAEFICSRVPCGQPGHTVSVDSEFFTVEHIDIDAGSRFELDSSAAHCLHTLAGSVDLVTNEAEVRLNRGESAFVPFGVRKYRGTALDDGVRLVKVNLP
jgi:mannose-6-phosphate isomerase class I